ncbi:unnamed protein product [Staurois parvus]|uniref:Uncharacterized protein n=1 Tax=Staurois parvus TaxID=386267 RepID=A0ABN9F8Q4_9NEOB|nr:unnamed protein product [Staurois parvus]
MSLFHIFKFPAILSPYVLTLQGTEPGRSAGEHCRGHCRRDIAEAKGKVREEEIPEQCYKVFLSVARGYRLCYTREYLQGG